MAAARFVFVSDRIDEPRAAQGDEEQTPEHWVWWRVVAANNRVLGRSADVFLGELTCRSQADQLRKRVDDAAESLTTDSRGQWMWTLWLDDIAVAESAHTFPRRVDCARTLALFVTGLGFCDAYGGPLRVYATGRYRKRSELPLATAPNPLWVAT